jgi:hypothetical protein
MPQFMLLLHDDPRVFADAPPEQLQAIYARYRDWRQSLVGSGKLAGGAKLTDEGGRRLQSRDGRVEVFDGPYAEAKEVLGGYFTVTAADYDEAVEIAKGCPHLDYGRIEVRQVDVT